MKNNYDVEVYRVDTYNGDRTQFRGKSVFFADSLDYFNNSDTEYRRENADRYFINLKDFKVFDPVRLWKNDIDVESWCVIRCSEDFALEHDLEITDYIDDDNWEIDDSERKSYVEVLIDTDSLAEYGRDNGYDITILRDIPQRETHKVFTEYAVHNSNAVKRDSATEFNKDSYNINEDTSKEQEDYFKDSKVRDSNGNLLVCYHGTPNSGFKEFSASDSKSQFGEYKFGKYNVNFFTTDRKSAASYTEMGYEKDNNVYACYVNIVNPFIVDNKSTSEIKSSFNIKDDRVREKQIKLFDYIFNKYKGRYVEMGMSIFKELNNDLHKLNLKLVPSDDYAEDADTDDVDIFNLVSLGNNSVWGGNRVIEYDYSVDELFDDSMYDELKNEIIGEDDDDYYLTTDDVVRYVLAMNEDDGTDYDGIIIEDIKDSKDMFANSGTDVITLKSSNQIKLISNEHPTSSNKIDENKLLDGFEYEIDKSYPRQLRKCLYEPKNKRF